MLTAVYIFVPACAVTTPLFSYPVPARISPQPASTVEVTGPDGVLSVTVRTDQPGSIRVTWYRANQPVMTENVTTTVEGDMSNTSTLGFSRRNESGEYRVIVGESRLPDVLDELPRMWFPWRRIT